MLRFWTGFLGGATASSSVLYYSVVSHNHTRSVQRAMLQQQVHTLSALCEPDGLGPTPAPVVRDGAVRSGLSVALQSRWNERVRNLANWAVGTGVTTTRN